MVNSLQGNPDQNILQERTVLATDDQEEAQELYNMSINDISEKSFTKNKIPKKLRKFIDMANIADSLSDRELENISLVVMQSFTSDKESITEWETVLKKSYDIISVDLLNNSGNYGATTTGKNIPWENAANVKYPLITSACVQFNAKTNPEIIKNDKVVAVRNMLPDDNNHSISNRAERLSSHMSYQLLSQSDHWVSDTDRLLMTLSLAGTVFRKSFFNVITGMPDTQFCPPDTIVVNNKIKSLTSAQRITHILYMTTNELIENMKMGLFLEYPIDDLLGSYEEETKPEVTQSFSTDDNENRTMTDIIHAVYEQHRYLDLDGDGYQEPYIVTVHEKSGKLLRIVARYDESSFEYNKKGDFVRINPIHYFTDYHFIPNPNGSFYSLGYGVLLLSSNETINTLINQLIDAGTLANNPCGIIGSGLRLPKGDLEFKPGEFKQSATASGSSIAENVYLFPFREPSSTLFTLLTFLIDSSKGITSILNVLTGENIPPNMPATTVMAMVEQGQQVYSSILYRIYDSLKREFEKLYKINSKYLENEEQFPMAQGMGMVTIQDYKMPNYGIYPVADPKLSSSMQRIFQAQALMQLLNTPQINNYEILKNYLETLKIQQPEQYLIKPNPNAPPPPEVQAIDAQIRNIQMDTACKLLDRELEAWKTGVDEMKVKSQSAYWAGRLTRDKVDSMVELTELEAKVPPAQIERAAIEEEALARETRFQDVPPDVHERLQSLENLVAQTMTGIKQEQQPQPQPQPQEQQIQGIEGAIPSPQPEASGMPPEIPE